MKQRIEAFLSEALHTLQREGKLPEAHTPEIRAEWTRDKGYGDYSSNLPLLLGKPSRQAPREIASALICALPQNDLIDKAEVAKAGFINFHIKHTARNQYITDLISGRLSLPEMTFEGVFDSQALEVMQYAHARISSVLRQLKERDLEWDQTLGCSSLDLLVHIQEQHLIGLVARFPEVLMNSDARLLECYLTGLANGLHAYYNAVHLLCDMMELRCARLCLLEAVRRVLGRGMGLMGISAREYV